MSEPESPSPGPDPSDLINASLTPPPIGQLGVVKRALRKLTLRLGRSHARHQQQIDRDLLRAIQRLEQLQADVTTENEARMTQQEARVDQVVAHLSDLGTWTTSLADRISALERRQDRADEHVATDEPIPLSPSVGLESFDVPHAGTVIGFRSPAEGPAGPDGVYLGFEESFRGSEELIRERQHRYVPLLMRHAPVLDVGCGRGEFLELMRAARTEARGIDLDPGMVAHCHSKGLANVECADAIRYLESLEEASQGTVFASHVIEHLPYEQLVRFLSLSLEKVAPGGLLVMETVNPHAPQALKHFWIDPTHRHPLFPEVMVALCRLTGFGSAYIWHPGGSGDPERDRLLRWDYSIVAQKLDAAR